MCTYTHTHTNTPQLDVFQPVTLRAYTRKHNMDKEPHAELAHHIQRRYKRRSTASHVDEKLDEQEMTLLKAGVKPTWLQIHRIINKRYRVSVSCRVVFLATTKSAGSSIGKW